MTNMTNGTNGATNVAVPLTVRKNNEYLSTLKVGHVVPNAMPWRRLGQYLYRILEDGSQTQMRLSMVESLIPPKSNGPVMHFHEMHDEVFIVTKGRVRFHTTSSSEPIDVNAGEIITVPTRVPHKFSNPFDEEGIFINLNTPGFYARYFEHLEELIGEGKELTPEVNIAAQRRFATIPLNEEEIMRLIKAGETHMQDGEEIDI